MIYLHSHVYSRRFVDIKVSEDAPLSAIYEAMVVDYAKNRDIASNFVSMFDYSDSDSLVTIIDNVFCRVLQEWFNSDNGRRRIKRVCRTPAQIAELTGCTYPVACFVCYSLAHIGLMTYPVEHKIRHYCSNDSDKSETGEQDSRGVKSVDSKELCALIEAMNFYYDCFGPSFTDYVSKSLTKVNEGKIAATPADLGMRAYYVEEGVIISVRSTLKTFLGSLRSMVTSARLRGPYDPALLHKAARQAYLYKLIDKSNYSASYINAMAVVSDSDLAMVATVNNFHTHCVLNSEAISKESPLPNLVSRFVEGLSKLDKLSSVVKVEAADEAADYYPTTLLNADGKTVSFPFADPSLAGSDISLIVKPGEFGVSVQNDATVTQRIESISHYFYGSLFSLARDFATSALEIGDSLVRMQMMYYNQLMTMMKDEVSSDFAFDIVAKTVLRVTIKDGKATYACGVPGIIPQDTPLSAVYTSGHELTSSDIYKLAALKVSLQGYAKNQGPSLEMGDFNSDVVIRPEQAEQVIGVSQCRAVTLGDVEALLVIPGISSDLVVYEDCFARLNIPQGSFRILEDQRRDRWANRLTAFITSAAAPGGVYDVSDELIAWVREVIKYSRNLFGDLVNVELARAGFKDTTQLKSVKETNDRNRALNHGCVGLTVACLKKVDRVLAAYVSAIVGVATNAAQRQRLDIFTVV